MASGLLTVALQDYPEAGGAAAALFGGAFMLVVWALVILCIIGVWKVFTKAGEPGWASIVPIYSAIVLLKIAGRPAWWFLILWLFIPWVIVCIDLAKKFGKDTGYGLGLAFLSFIFFPLLGFSDAKYQG